MGSHVGCVKRSDNLSNWILAVMGFAKGSKPIIRTDCLSRKANQKALRQCLQQTQEFVQGSPCDEAIHSFMLGCMDCFASIAMTITRLDAFPAFNPLWQVGRLRPETRWPCAEPIAELRGKVRNGPSTPSFRAASIGQSGCEDFAPDRDQIGPVRRGRICSAWSPWMMRPTAMVMISAWRLPISDSGTDS